MKRPSLLLLWMLMGSTIAILAQQAPDFPEPGPSPYDTLLVEPPRCPEPNIHISWAPSRKILNLQEVVATIAWSEAAYDTSNTIKLVYTILFDGEGKYVKHKIVRGGDPLLHRVVDRSLKKLRAEVLIFNKKAYISWEYVTFEIPVKK